MENFKERLRESYFNPTWQILPALVFIVVNSLCGCCVGGWAALALAVGLSIYVRKAYPNLFRWYMWHTVIALGVVGLMTLSIQCSEGTRWEGVADKITFLLALTVIYAMRKPMTRLSDKLVSKLLPMSNNIAELYKVIRVLIVMSVLYIGIYTVAFMWGGEEIECINVLSGIFLLLVIANYTMKTKFVRAHLAQERWLPILASNGRVVGTIQRLTSLSDGRKYTHPVVRGIVVCDGRILMHRAADKNDLFYKCRWDNFISYHIGIGEKAEDCLRQVAEKHYGLTDLKTFFLTQYTHETPYECQYALVYIIADYEGIPIPAPDRVAQLKWWTVSQIEANLQDGVFTNKFLKEYELLKRSGLLDKGEEKGDENAGENNC